MPYPNYHAARLQDPDKFDEASFRTTAGGKLYLRVTVPDTVNIIWGKLKGAAGPNDPIIPQALRFRIDAWTVEKAKAWLAENRIEVILFEPATNEKYEASEDVTYTAYADLGIEAALAAPIPVDGRAYNGGKIQLPGWPLPAVVDLRGMLMADTVPLVLNHKSETGTKAGDVHARIRDNGIDIVGSIISDEAEIRNVIDQGKLGGKWQLSIGGGTVERELVTQGRRFINGQWHEAPFFHVKQSVLRHVAIVACGADAGTRLSIAAAFTLEGGQEMEFEKWLKDTGFDAATLTEQQKTGLRASFELGAGKEDKRSLDEITASVKAELDRQDQITAMYNKAVMEQPERVEDLDKLARAAIEGKAGVQDFELSLLRATRSGVRSSHSRQEEAPASSIIEAAVCISGGLDDDSLVAAYGEQTLEQARSKWSHGLSLQDLLMEKARQHGYRGLSVKSDLRGVLQAAFMPDFAAGGPSTLSLPGIMSNVANKFMVRGFDAVESAWRQITSIRSVNDFKQVSSYALTGGFEFVQVGPTGELKHATAGEEEYLNRARTYGIMFSITREDIINDNLGALTQVPSRIGRGGALALNRVFWTTLLANGGTPATFFVAGNSNVSTGALSLTAGIASLSAAELVFLNQTDPDGNPLGVTPKILLVPNALKTNASVLMTSAKVKGSAEGPDENPHAGKFNVVSSAYLSNAAIPGYSAAAFYLLADPADVAVIETAFLNGQERPTVETADADFNVLGVQMRGFFDFGVALQEPRGGVRSTGA